MLNANCDKAANFKFEKLEILLEKKCYIIYIYIYILTNNRRDINYGEIILIILIIFRYNNIIDKFTRLASNY